MCRLALAGDPMRSLRYGDLEIELLGDTGGRIRRTSPTAAAPGVVPRSVPTVTPPPLLLGRDEQLQDARRAIAARRPFGLHAPCGFGKSTLLHGIAADSSRSGTPALFLRAGSEDTGKLLRRIFAAFYESDRPMVPTPEQGAEALAGVAAVIVLDDVMGGFEQVEPLIGNLPGSSFVFSSPQPFLGRHGVSQSLPGLSDDAARELVAHELDKPLTELERSAVTRFVDAVEGQPLRLRQAAALVRADEYAFDELSGHARRDPQTLDRLSLDALAEHERRVLAVLALAAGALLPGDLVTGMSDVDGAIEALRKLRRRGLAEQRNDRFGLPVCQADSYRPALFEYLNLSSSVRELGRWLVTRELGSEESENAAAAALSLIAFMAERREWTAVIRLVRAVEPILIIMGHWEAWNHVLNQGIEAARGVRDQASEAFFSNQQGLIAFCEDRLDAARNCFERALDIWERLGDEAGAAVTRHNLTQLGPLVIPPPPPSTQRPVPPRRTRWWVVAAASAAAVTTLGIGVGVLVSGGDDSPPDAPSPAPESIVGTYVSDGGSEFRLLIESAGENEYRATGTQEVTHGIDSETCEQDFGPDTDPTEAVIRGEGSSFEGRLIQVHWVVGDRCFYGAYDVTVNVIDQDTLEVCGVEEPAGCLTYQRQD